MPGVAPEISEAGDGIEATVDYSSSTSEQSAGIRGSLAYMSPEQALGLPATPASDVFSFGLMLVEMLTGRRAHAEQSPVRLPTRLQSRDLVPELVREVEDAYQELLLPMLAHDADRRRSMSEVARRVASGL